MSKKPEGIVDEIINFNKFKKISLVANLSLILFFFLPWVKATAEFLDGNLLGIYITRFFEVMPEFNYSVLGMPNGTWEIFSIEIHIAAIFIYAIPVLALINLIISLELFQFGNEKIMHAFTGTYVLLLFSLFIDMTGYRAITQEVFPYLGIGVYLMVISAIIMVVYAIKGPSKKRYHGSKVAH